MIRKALVVSILAGALAATAARADWPSWRGPSQTGSSLKSAPVTSWSPRGENVLWKVPIGGRTTPILMDGRLFMITPTGEGECLREQVICLDADTGRTIWTHTFNVFNTDIVEARLGWTSVVGDPETGNVYAHGTGGEFFCLSRDGDVVWKHSLGESFGRYSGYGGRLHTPIIDEDRVIISYVYILSNWGTGKRKAGHRYVAFDKRTGEVQWWSQPGGRPLDTTYSVPVVAVVDGRRMLIAGNADGNIYGMLARNGAKVWTFRLSKRGINSTVVVDGNYVYATHSEENVTGTEMGRIVCIDASKTGNITETGTVWQYDECKVGYASPALAGGRLYVATNSANLMAFDAKTGKVHWKYNLGTAMKGSPTVTADGIIYVGEVNGRFHILKDAGDHCEPLDFEQLRRPDGAIVEINGSPIVADGRVFFLTSYEMYCLGARGKASGAKGAAAAMTESPPDKSKPAMLQIIPGDVTVAPGERLQLRTRLWDVNGRAIGSPEARWEAVGVDGTFASPAVFVASTENAFSAGVVRAKVGELTAEARVRISPTMPIVETFDGLAVGAPPPGWIGVDLKATLIEREGTVVLHKLARSPSAPFSRMRAFSGPPIAGGYTVLADLLGTPKKGRRPVLSDMGLINSRYKLILLGREKQVRIVSYSPIPRLQKDVPFDWQPDVWYRAKLRVDLDGGQAIVRGKIWPRDEREPDAWTIEVTDPCPNTEGSPGLYAYSKGTSASKHGASVFFDNYQVLPNE